jgi:hypothetical protein
MDLFVLAFAKVSLEPQTEGILRRLRQPPRGAPPGPLPLMSQRQYIQSQYAYITYFASVVSRETVRIILTLTGLNNSQVKVPDIENAYITGPCTKKIWTVLGPKFGSDAG